MLCTDDFFAEKIIRTQHFLHSRQVCYTALMKLALKVTPQRSTQYANMAQSLAIPELLASPLHPAITDVASITLAGQRYLLADISEDRLSSAEQLHVLHRLGAVSE